MHGFSGRYQHQAGDIFVFKGGVTWPASCFPMTISYSGSSGDVDTYTAETNWHTGTSWNKPIFDGGGNMGRGTAIIDASSRSFIKINNLDLRKTGKPNKENGARVILVNYSSDIEISYCNLTPYGNHIIVGVVPRRNSGNLLIHHNEISHFANAIEIGFPTNTKSVTFSNLQIYNNHFFDPASQMVEGDHVSPIQILSLSYYRGFRGVKIYNNVYDGDWGGNDGITTSTAQIYLSRCCEGVEIFNNVLTMTNTTYKAKTYIMSPGQIALYSSHDIKVYNNTVVSDSINAFAGPGSTGVMSGIALNDSHKVDIQNNIFSGQRISVNLDSNSSGITSDYNILNPRSDGQIASMPGAFRITLPEWKQIAGVGSHEMQVDPGFVNGTEPPHYDLHISSDSKARDAGNTLPNIFSTDIENKLRPQGPAWDIGAYEYRAINAEKAPQKPTNLKILKSQ
jgi:hypothetical protein